MMRKVLTLTGADRGGRRDAFHQELTGSREVEYDGPDLYGFSETAGHGGMVGNPGRGGGHRKRSSRADQHIDEVVWHGASRRGWRPGWARAALGVSEWEADIARFIDGAIDGAQRAAELTKRLLAFSRQQPLAPKRINVNRLVGDMSELFIRTLGETIQVETVLGAGLWHVEVDLAQLESALLNLSVNARDAMPGGGRLTIETANAHVDGRYAREYSIPEGQYVLVCVTDTGTGMSPEVFEKAFDPFYTTKGVGKGTGLGLSQVYGFVRQSGGRVKLYSKVGVGTTVKIYLPRSLAGTPDEVVAPVAAIYGGQSTEVVMVVEDDDRVRAMAVEALRDLGYSVMEMRGPMEALASIQSAPAPDLLFTDIVMPDMSRLELVEQVKALEPRLKILYTTGYTRNAIVHNGTLDFGTELLSKPYTVEELAAKVRSILDQ